MSPEIKWLILTGVVKFGLALAPFTDVSNDFNLGGMAAEAKEFAGASSTKMMLFASPVLLALQTLNRVDDANTAGHHIAFNVAVFLFCLAVLLFIVYCFRSSWFRGFGATIVWFIVLTFSEAYYEFSWLTYIANKIVG